jgi:dCTP deaminase
MTSLTHGYHGILNDLQIEELVREHNMIESFIPEQRRSLEDGSKAISFGLTSYGYDIRIKDTFLIFNDLKSGRIDPLNFSESDCLIPHEGPYCDIPPRSYILAHTVEKFNMPADVIGRCVGKSTYARCGLIINVTPLEPSWSGHLTLELANATPCPLRVYANMGIGQIQFEKGLPAKVTYANRPYGAGKYQDQDDRPVTARI